MVSVNFVLNSTVYHNSFLKNKKNSFGEITYSENHFKKDLRGYKISAKVGEDVVYVIRVGGVTSQVNTLLTLIQNQVIHDGKNVSLKAPIIFLCWVTT